MAPSQQWINFTSLSRQTVPCFLTLGWQLRTCPRYAKPWVGAQGHYSIVNWSATKTNFVEYSVHWMHLDPKKHLITSYLLMRLLLRWLLMGSFFSTRELQIWIFCQLKKWSRNMHTRYVLTNKCFREGANSEECMGEPHPHFFELKIGNKCCFFYNIKNHPLIFFSKSIPGPPFGNIWIRLCLTLFLAKHLKQMCGFQAVRSYVCTCSIWPTDIQWPTRQLQCRANNWEILVLSDLYSCSCMYSLAKT